MGGILTGGYKVVTGFSGMIGGSPERAAADEAWRSKTDAARIGAVEANQQGNFEAGKLRAMGSQLIARQKVAYTNSGVEAGSGTALSAMIDTRMMSEQDARMAENNAARRVRGFKEQKRQARSEWELAKSADEQKQTGTFLGGIGDIASSVFKGGMG